MTSKTKQLADRLPRLHINVVSSLLILLALALIATLPLLTQAFAEEVFDRFSYWSMTALLGMGGYRLLVRFPTIAGLKNFLQMNRLPLVIAALATSILALSVPKEFRDLLGETNLLSVSNSLLRVHAPRIPEAATFAFDNFNALINQHDGQPILFSYLTHLFHLIRGVRAENVFVANLVVWFGLIFVVASLVTRKNSLTLGIVAVLALLGQPLLTLQATSAGPELLFLLMFVLTLLQLRRFLVSKTQTDLTLFWLASLLFAMSHADALFLAPALYFSLFLLGYIKGELRAPYALGSLFAAVLLYPFFCQQLMAPPALALSHFWPNLKSLATALFDVRAESSFSRVLTVTALLAIIGAHRRKSDFRLLAMLAVGFQGLLVLCQSGAVASDPIAARYFLPLALLLALSPVLLAPRWGLRYLVPLVLANFLWYHPLSVDGKVDQTLVKNRELRGVRQFVNAQHLANVAIVSDTPSMYAAFDYGAFSFDYARTSAPFLHSLLKLRYLAKIYVVQTMDGETKTIAPEQEVPPGFTLTPVKELLLTETQRVKISELSETP